MKRFKSITYFIYSFIICFFGLIVLQQIIYNPLYIFKEPPAAVDSSQILVNESFLKQKYLFKNGKNFDSFLIGASSSGNVILTSENNGKWYNFSVVYFSLWETERLLKHLFENNVKINNLVIALSEENLKNNEGGNYFDICNSRYSVQFYPFPFLINEKFYFYTKNFLTFPLFTSLKEKIEASYKVFADNRYKADFSYTDQEVIDRLPMVKNPFIKERLYEIKKISDFCKENNITVYFYFTPIYHQVYKNGIIEDYNNFKKEIVQITPFYDFSGLNPVTNNHKYFSDLIHGTEETGTLIKDRIFCQDKNIPPKIKDFGIYVTKENINKHIELMNKQMEKDNEYKRI